MCDPQVRRSFRSNTALHRHSLRLAHTSGGHYVEVCQAQPSLTELLSLLLPPPLLSLSQAEARPARFTLVISLLQVRLLAPSHLPPLQHSFAATG